MRVRAATGGQPSSRERAAAGGPVGCADAGGPVAGGPAGCADAGGPVAGGPAGRVRGPIFKTI